MCPSSYDHSLHARGPERIRPRLASLAAVVAVLASVLTLVGDVLSAPAGAAGYETPAIADTAYPVPAGALFVDGSSGNDANPGSASAPFRTVGRAVAAAPAGATVVIRQGTYRESLGYVSKPLTIQPYPHEKVWLKGSVVVGDWVSDGPGVWRRDNWTYRFCRQSTDGQCYLNALIDPAYPAAGLPDMVFVDGAPLAQVTSRQAVGAGTFYVDYATSRLYIGADPTSRSVEATAYDLALQVNNASGFSVRGLGFAHYASVMAYGNGSATVVLSAPNVTFENNTVAWGASTGLAVYNYGGANVRGNTLIYNGFDGLIGNLIDNSAIVANRIAYNNQERFWFDNPSHAADADAGAKIARSKHLVVADNVFEGNWGMGFWCDLSCYDVTVVRNIFRSNAQYGLFYEVSAKAVVASNLVVANARAGIFVSGSSDVRIYNNTLVGNKHNLYVFEDPRPTFPCTPDTCPTSAEQSLGITWDTQGVVVKNNILSNGDGTTVGLFGGSPDFVHVLDGNSPPKFSPDQMVTAIDYNAYHRTDATLPSNLINWGGTTYKTEQEFQASGHDAHGMELNGLTDPFFVNEVGGDYRLQTGSQAVGRGEALPADVAVAIGVPPSPVNLGALAWPGMSAPTSTTTTAPPATTTTTTAPASSASGLDAAVYRLRSARGYHLYTLNAAERDSAISLYGYTSEGTSYLASGVAGSNVSPVYRLVSASGDRLYTTNAAERDSAVSQYGYSSEGVAFYASTKPGTGLVPVYRLLSNATGDHLYTASTSERDSLVATSNYVVEMTAFYAASTASGTVTTTTTTTVAPATTTTTTAPTATTTTLPSSTVALAAPVYRLRSSAGYHLYTASASERDSAVSSFEYASEGAAFSASPTGGSNVVPVYRLAGSSGDRLYTTSAAERDSAVANYGYTSDGIAFYATPQAGRGLVPVYRLLNTTSGDHLYTANPQERDSLVASSTYVLEVTSFYAGDTISPAAVITSPAAGAKVGNSTSIGATATDNVAVTRTELSIDGKLVATSSSGSITYTWGSRSASKGSHTLTVVAYDAAGNKSQTSLGVTK